MFKSVNPRVSRGRLKVCRGRRVAAGALAVLLVVLSACSSDPPSPASIPPKSSTPSSDDRVAKAEVVNVIDGATIDVELDGQVLQVRYLGIEIPDAEDGGPESLSLGDRAVSFNAFLVEGRTVELERGTTDTDASGRLLRYVYVDGEMVNKAMLTNGYATVAAWPETFEHRTDFAVAEESAKKAKRGTSPRTLWP